MTITARYHQLTAQRAYELRIKHFGLAAILAPYTQKPVVRVPPQRAAS